MTAIQLGPQTRSHLRLYDQPEPKLRLTPRTLGAVTAVAMLYSGGLMLLNLAGIQFTVPDIVDPPVIVLQPWKPLEPEPPVERPVLPTEAVIKRPTTTLPDFTETAPTATPLAPTAGEPIGPLFTDATSSSGPMSPEPTAPTEPAPEPAVIRNPAWLSKPTAAQLGRLYPYRAAERGLSGMVNMECRVTAQGTMSACVVLSETPLRYGFGDAALASTKYFKMSPRTVDGAPVEGAKVRIPMGFTIGN